MQRAVDEQVFDLQAFDDVRSQQLGQIPHRCLDRLAAAVGDQSGMCDLQGGQAREDPGQRTDTLPGVVQIELAHDQSLWLIGREQRSDARWLARLRAPHPFDEPPRAVETRTLPRALQKTIPGRGQIGRLVLGRLRRFGVADRDRRHPFTRDRGAPPGEPFVIHTAQNIDVHYLLLVNGRPLSL